METIKYTIGLVFQLVFGVAAIGTYFNMLQLPRLESESKSFANWYILLFPWTYPRIEVCRTDVLASSLPFHRELLRKIISKHSREDKTVVDFSVCNMEEIQKFNGSFILWMAEMQAIGLVGKNGWVVKKMVENNIIELPPAKMVGCVLPDQFSFPKLSGEQKFSIIVWPIHRT